MAIQGNIITILPNCSAVKIHVTKQKHTGPSTKTISKSPFNSWVKRDTQTENTCSLKIWQWKHTYENVQSAFKAVPKENSLH